MPRKTTAQLRKLEALANIAADMQAAGLTVAELVAYAHLNYLEAVAPGMKATPRELYEAEIEGEQFDPADTEAVKAAIEQLLGGQA